MYSLFPSGGRATGRGLKYRPPLQAIRNSHESHEWNTNYLCDIREIRAISGCSFCAKARNHIKEVRAEKKMEGNGVNESAPALLGLDHRACDDVCDSRRDLTPGFTVRTPALVFLARDFTPADHDSGSAAKAAVLRLLPPHLRLIRRFVFSQSARLGP